MSCNIGLREQVYGGGGRRTTQAPGRLQGIAPTLPRIGLRSPCIVGAIPCGRPCGGAWGIRTGATHNTSVPTHSHQLKQPWPAPDPRLTARVNPTIRRISPLSPWRRSAGLVPVLGWCGQPFALSLSVHGRRKRPHPLPHRSRPYGSGPSLLLKISNRSRLYLYDSSPLSTCVSIRKPGLWIIRFRASVWREICDGITKIELEHN